MTFPRFLTSPDPNIDPDYLRRARIAYPSIVRYQAEDRPLLLNTGFGDEPLTVELACEWAERLADEVLK